MRLRRPLSSARAFVWRLAFAAIPSVALAGAMVIGAVGPDNPVLLVDYGGAAWFLGEWLQVLALPYIVWLWLVRRPLALNGFSKRIAIIVTLFIASVVVSDEVISRKAPQVFIRLMPPFGDAF